MYKKIFIINVLCLIFFSSIAYAGKDDIVREMSKNLRVDNTRCLNLPGNEGSLGIFIEKKKIDRNIAGKVYINYNYNEIGLHAGNNFVITKDSDVVFVKNGRKVYARIDGKKFNDPLVIKVCSFVLITYDKKNLIVKVEDKEIKAKEILFDRSKLELSILENGKAVKTINVPDCRNWFSKK